MIVLRQSERHRRPIFLAAVTVLTFTLLSLFSFNKTYHGALEQTQYKGTASNTNGAPTNNTLLLMEQQAASDTAPFRTRTGHLDATSDVDGHKSSDPEDDLMAVHWNSILSTTAAKNETFYYVAQQPARISNQNTARICIVHVKPNTQYSVMAFAPGKYIKAGLQLTTTTLPTTTAVNVNNKKNHSRQNNTNKNTMEFALHLPFAAEYKLLVHEIQPILSKKYPRRLPPPPFNDSFSSSSSLSSMHRLLVTDSLAAVLPIVEGAAQPLPPCQTVPYNALVPWQGDWVGPQAAPTNNTSGHQRRHHPLRTGWSFAPETCVLETFTAKELYEISKSTTAIATSTLSTTTDHNDATQQTAATTTIAVLGTSRERGIFLSIVDMMLNAREKDSLQQSKVGKCWGRASVRLNNLKVIYQDARTHLCNVHDIPGTVTCHGDAIAAGSGFLQNATDMVQVLFSANHKNEWPQVVVLWSGVLNKDLIVNSTSTYYLHNEPHEHMQATSVILASFPRDWNGTLYLTSGMMDAKDDEITSNDYENYIQNLQWFQSYLNDTRVRMLDVYRLAADMRLHNEQPGKIHGSTHFHRWCNDLYYTYNSDNDDDDDKTTTTNRTTTSTMRVCSNVTEALANLVIARAVAPWGKKAYQDTIRNSDSNKNTSSIVVRELEVCTDCPAKLMPFHIIPHPQLECTTGAFIAPANVAGPAFDNHCPKTCMATRPVGKVMTQSGFIMERICIPNTAGSSTNASSVNSTLQRWNHGMDIRREKNE
jgi:hypothetical protein